MSRKKYPGRCEICGKQADDLCPDLACKACHKSVSWEECSSGTFNARILISNGHPRKEFKKLYPDADI